MTHRDFTPEHFTTRAAKTGRALYPGRPPSGIDKDKVPQWLKEALERWENED
jgi:hypothetical protein